MSLSKACRYLGFSRQAYYQWQQRQGRACDRNQSILTRIRQIRCRQPRIGTRKLHHLLNKERHVIGRDALFGLLRVNQMLVPRQRAYHKTTYSHHRFYRHPNLLKQSDHQVSALAPEEVWVADITYLPLQQGEAYLSLITDAYSRKIVGYQVERHMQASSVAKALQQAIKTRRTHKQLIHHSDRGVQYCSAYYQALHKRYGITCSMTDGYDCYQNALAERVNGILKTEFLLSKPSDLSQAKQLVKQAIEIYKQERPHSALNYKTPDEVHRAFI